MTTIKELIKEFENIKLTKCKTIQEMMFFDGVLAIIEGKYIEKEKEQMITCFLSGKRFSDGERYAPLASLDIAEEWFKSHYEAQS
jgi:hypothetical protein